MNITILEEALSERLSLKSPALFLVPNNIPSDEAHDIANDKILLYLYRSYQRLMTRNQKECEEIRQLILRSGSEVLRKSEPHSSLSEQWLELLHIYYDDTEKECEFLSKIVFVVYSENDLLKRKSFHFIFDDIFDKAVKRTSTITIEKWAFLLLNGFVIDGANPKLGQLIVDQFTQNTQSLDIVSNLLFQMRYRRTIFTIMEYLFRLDEQRRHINKMASDSLETAKNSMTAKKDIDKKKPQLFFRFIISLISDVLYMYIEKRTIMECIE